MSYLVSYKQSWENVRNHLGTIFFLVKPWQIDIIELTSSTSESSKFLQSHMFHLPFTSRNWTKYVERSI